MRTNNSINNIITIILSNIISFIFVFISQTVFIKTLGIEYVGLNGLFSNVLTFLNLLELGIGNAIVYNLYNYIAKNNKEKIKSIMFFYKKAYNYIIILVLITGLLFIPFIHLIVDISKVDINIYVVYILFLLSSISSYILAYKRNILYASQKNYIITIIHIVYIILLNVSEIIVLVLTKNYYLYLILRIIFILMENIIISIYTNKKYPYLLDKNIKPLDIRTKKSIIEKVKAIFIHKLSTTVTNGTDNILISIFLGIKTVGLYTNYNYIIKTTEKFFKNIILSTTASVGNLIVEEDYEKRYQVFKRIKFLNFWIAIVVASCLLYLTESFIEIWIGKKYLLDNIVLMVLVCLFFMSMMRATYNIFKDGAGIWVEDKYIPIIQIIINLASSVILLTIIGLPGVFLGTIISSLVLWCYSYPKYVYKTILNQSYKTYIIEVIEHIIIFIFIELFINIIIKNILIDNPILNISIRLMVVLLLSNIILVIIYNRTDNYKYYVELIKNKLLKKSKK